MWNMNIADLSEYLDINETTLKKWDSFFFDENENKSYSFYPESKIKALKKIKNLAEKGKSIEEIKDLMDAGNPFLTKNFIDIPKFEVIADDRISVEKIEFIVKPILNQLEKAHSKIEQLLLEKSKIIEENANEKARLFAEIEILKFKNSLISKNRNDIEKITAQTPSLTDDISQTELIEALEIAQELLKEKTEETDELKAQICEKEELIKNNEEKFEQLMHKKNTKKWWAIWK
jgi:DNA-binding transcriptional MerR regulator